MHLQEVLASSRRAVPVLFVLLLAGWVAASLHGADAPGADVPGVPDVWVRIGPFGATVYTVVAVPGDPGTVFAGTSGGLFRSDDGFATWEPVEITGRWEPGVRSIWIDPDDPATIVVGTDDVLFRSTDGGATWERSQVELPIPIPEKPICLVADPSVPDILYACSGYTYFVFDLGQGVLASTDGGASFHPTSPQLANASVTSLLAVPGSPALLLAAVPANRSAGGPTGVLASVDGGVTWTPRNTGLVLPPQPPGVSQLARDAQTGTIFALVAATGAIFASRDAALSWTPVAAPARASAIAIGPDGALYLSSVSEEGGRIFRSTDEGASWLDTGAPAPATLLPAQPELPAVFAAARDGLILSRNGGETWGLSRRGFGDRPAMPLAVAGDGSVYASWGERLYRRKDGFWRPLSGSTQQLIVDPANPERLFSAPGLNLMRSLNGGRTWQQVDLPDACVEIATVTFAPSDRRVLYTGGTAPEGSGPGHHPEPDASCLRKCQAWRSDDSGATWTCLPLENVYRFVVDPLRPRTVYGVGALSETFPNLQYIAKSVDGGRTWKDASQGLGQLGGVIDSYLLTIDPTAPSRLFTFVDRTPGHRLFVSQNGGASWTPRGRDLPGGAYPVSLLLARSRPDVFYAGTSEGILRSADGGRTWAPLAPGLEGQVGGPLVADPTQPLLFYAGTGQRGILVLRRSKP